MPLYVRAGAILPMGPVKQYTGERADGPLTLTVHPGADGGLSLYEDDGATFHFRKGEFMRIGALWRDSARRLSLRLAPGSRMMEPKKRDIAIALAGESASRAVVFDGSPLEVKL